MSQNKERYCRFPGGCCRRCNGAGRNRTWPNGCPGCGGTGHDCGYDSALTSASKLPHPEPPSPAGEIASMCSHGVPVGCFCDWCDGKSLAVPEPVPAEGAAPCEWYGKSMGQHEWLELPQYKIKRCIKCKIDVPLSAPEAAAAYCAHQNVDWAMREIGRCPDCGATLVADIIQAKKSAAPIAPAAQDELIAACRAVIREWDISIKAGAKLSDRGFISGTCIWALRAALARAESYRKESEAKNG